MKMKKTKILGLVLALIMFFTNLPFGSGIVHAEGEDDVAIIEDNFPDELFLEYVKQFDENKDGNLSKEEREKVQEINVERTNKDDFAYDYLNGIEFFPNLKELNFANNQVKVIDLKKNKELTVLNCSENIIESLDLSENKKLEKLNCSGNHLNELNLDNNLSLLELSCSKQELKNFDVSKLKNLVSLTCETCRLEELNLRENTKLSILNCAWNNFTELDLSSNTELTELYCYDNTLKTLDLTKNSKLKKIFSGDAQLEKLLLPENNEITEINLESNNLTEIDLSQCKKLTRLNCCRNDKLTTLDVSNNTELEYIDCWGDALTSLDLSKNTKLTDFNSHTQKYTITLVKGVKLIKPSDLPEGFDLSKVISDSVQFADLTSEGFVLKPKANEVKYNYMTNNGDYKIECSIVVKRYVNLIIKKDPKLEYKEGDKLDLSDLVVTLRDGEGNEVDVPYEKFPIYNIKTKPLNETVLKRVLNGTRIEISVEELKAETNELIVMDKDFDPNNITKIKVRTQATKMKYTEGENLNLAGIVVTLVDNLDNEKDVTLDKFAENGITTSPENGYLLKLSDNTKPIKIIKDDLSVFTDQIEVIEDTFNPEKVTKIEVKEDPVNLTYNEGENLALAGLVVTLTDNNGKTIDIEFADFGTYNIIATPQNGTELKAADHNGKPIIITKGELEPAKTSVLTVKAKEFDKENITKIEIKAQASKMSYTEGDKLNLAGLVVTLTDNQGLIKDVTLDKFAEYGLTVTPANDTDLTLTDNGKTIKIAKGDVSVETNDLEVKEKEEVKEFDKENITKIEVKAQAGKMSYTEGDKLNLAGLEVTLTDNQGTTEDVAFVDFAEYSLTATPENDTALTLADNGKTIKITTGDVSAETSTLEVKAKVNPPVDPSIPSDNIIGPLDSSNELYKELDKHSDEYYKIVFMNNDYTRSAYVLFVKKGQGICLNDIADYAPPVVTDEGYVFTGWAPRLRGNFDIIDNGMFINAEFEEIGSPYRPYWPDNREEKPYRPYRPYKPNKDTSKDNVAQTETKPVTEETVKEKIEEKKSYDKLELVLNIDNKTMQKSVNGVVGKYNNDVAPFIYQARTMLPIRYVAEALGFMVTWDANTRTVYLVDKENIVQIPVDTNNIIVNGKAFVSDVKPMIKNNRTMLPVANVARALGLQDGKDILWDAAMKFVTLRRNVLK